MKETITVPEHEQIAATLIRMRRELDSLARWLLTKNMHGRRQAPTRLVRAAHHLSLAAFDLMWLMTDDHDEHPDPVPLYDPDSLTFRTRQRNVIGGP